MYTMKKHYGIAIITVTSAALFYCLNEYLNKRTIDFKPYRAVGALCVGIMITFVLVKLVFKKRDEGE